MRIVILTVLLLSLIPFSLYASGRSNSGGLAERVAELEAQVEELSAILEFVHVETGEINRLAGPHWIVEGANVHVRSGSGETGDGCNIDDPNCESLTGLGNLIVGYNEKARRGGDPSPHEPPEKRTGSHNLVVGKWHSYPGFGGFVAGSRNFITGPYASVTGGTYNMASGDVSSVSGGHHNLASGPGASVSGGHRNDASGLVASVSGGQGNKASGVFASVSGGFRNEANGDWASVSGGQDGEAPDNFNWVAGDLFEPN